ncbi:MAG: hypothetical protein AAFZ18_06295 [Myxococcota bacterium]
MLELSEELLIRSFRMEARYTATRLLALPETRSLAGDFEEAHDKLALLEDEGARLDLRRIEIQATVEIADDAWDDTVLAFQRRLLELVDNNVDAELYRGYFADIPSHVTSLSYAAEVMISRELEQKLSADTHLDLQSFSSRLAEKRASLEAALHERTRLEVDEARFQNRVALAKAILNKLRRVLFASLEEVARARGYPHGWCFRFFHSDNDHFEASLDGVEELEPAALPEGDLADPG